MYEQTKRYGVFRANRFFEGNGIDLYYYSF